MVKLSLNHAVTLSTCFCVFCGLVMLYSTMFDPTLEFLYLDLSVFATQQSIADTSIGYNQSNELLPIAIDQSILEPTSLPPINTSDLLHIIRELRIKPPPKCPNSTHHLLPITPSDHNWAPYYFRCKDLYHQHSPPKRPWIDEGLISKELFFVHVFKAGGTTVRVNMDELMAKSIVSNLTFLGSTFVVYGGPISRYSKTDDDKYSQHSILDNFVDNETITFSFVRDPIDKFLSAFYEAHYREFNTSESKSGLAAKYGTKSGIEIMRLWIDEMQNRFRRESRKIRMELQRVRKESNHLEKRRRLRSPWINSHLFPNMRFLMGQHYQSNIPFNFIGDLKHFEDDFPQIIEPFIVDEEMKKNHTKFMELMRRIRVRSHDNWDHKLSKYHIDRSELSEEDIIRICDLYYLDYLCLPFDLPESCDIDKLIDDHYGIDVQYKDCY